MSLNFTNSSMNRTVQSAVIILLIAGTLAGCAASETVPPPAAPSVPESSDTGTNAAVCADIVRGQDSGPLWDVIDYFATYAGTRDAVTHDDAVEAIARLDTLRDGTAGDVAEAFDGMRQELVNVELRYSGDDPLLKVDYQAFSDSAVALVDACEAQTSNG